MKTSTKRKQQLERIEHWLELSRQQTRPYETPGLFELLIATEQILEYLKALEELQSDQ